MRNPFVIILLFLTGLAYAANELNTQVALTYNKNGAVIQFSQTKQVTVAGDQTLDFIVPVTTNESQLNLLGMTAGVCAFQNLTTNDFVLIGTTQGVYQIKLGASEVQTWRPNGTNLFLKSGVTNCNVRAIIISN